MKPAPRAKSSHFRKPCASVSLLAFTCLLASGCGTPGAPQPPSLHLPIPVSDLTAVRSGSTVTLHWTNPRKTTDRLLIKGPIRAQICWQMTSGHCESVELVDVEPGAKVEFRESLPAEQQEGSARPLNYFVELRNLKGRSAGPSNPAPVLAGNAPAPVTGLRAEARPDGAALHWTEGENTAVRLHRKLLNPTAPQRDSSQGLMKSQPPPVLRDLLVEPGAVRDGALDRTANFGDSYEYTAQRIARVPVNGQVNGQILELAGDLSVPVRVDMIDTFPPAVPSGLEAVAVPDDKTIDLSWQPDTDSDLAGYIVYRADSANPASPDSSHPSAKSPHAESPHGGAWTRISGPQPLPAPAYRDSTPQPGHTYLYAVTAIDQTGHESARSPEAAETMPNPQ
jgi:hypothetical protein